MPQIFNSITIGFVSGAFAGWIAAKAVMKMNKNFNFRYAISLPVIIILVTIIGDVSGYLNKHGNLNYLIRDLIREFCTIFLFIMTLRDEAKITK